MLKNHLKHSIWFSKLVTKFIEIDTKKTPIKITKILPVIREERLFDVGESEKNITLSELKSYLQTVSSENLM